MASTSTLPFLLLLLSCLAFAAPVAYRNDPHEHDLAGRRLVASAAAATTTSARLATPATPATTAALPPTTNNGCGVLNGATFRGESRKPIEAVFGGGSVAEAVLAARATYPHTVPDNTTQIHFLLALTFHESGLARMVFQAEPCVKRFQCDTVRWSRATSRDDSSSSMTWHGSREANGEANGEAGGVDAVTIDPSDCEGLMHDPLLRSDLERDGGRFHLPCVGVGAEGSVGAGGGAGTVGRIDGGWEGMSVRSICPNLPLLTARR